MHRRARLLLTAASAALLGLSLAACAATSVPDASATPSPVAPPSATPTPTPIPTPTDRVVVISVDGLSVDGAPTISYTDSNGAVAALTDAFGSAPVEGPVEGAYGSVYAGFDWEGTKATIRETRIDLVVSADATGVTFRTPEGIGLGSTRAEAEAAGAQAGFDEDGDGIPDHLGIGMREVPGTSSLVHPGEVGVEYIDLRITDDVVTRLTSGANDFSDL